MRRIGDRSASDRESSKAARRAYAPHFRRMRTNGLRRERWSKGTRVRQRNNRFKFGRRGSVFFFLLPFAIIP
ncbi:hypothetical protein AGMMS49925_01210 [Deltaproteobacteria bacterium]|nr:hypothetical protein AGMMS49925_01210 [Deltaproteobacteria bacterium]